MLPPLVKRFAYIKTSTGKTLQAWCSELHATLVDEKKNHSFLEHLDGMNFIAGVEQAYLGNHRVKM